MSTSITHVHHHHSCSQQLLLCCCCAAVVLVDATLLLQVPKQLATIACKAGTDYQAYSGSLAVGALMLLLQSAADDGLLRPQPQTLGSTSSATSSQPPQKPLSVMMALAAALTQQLQLSGLVQQLPAVLRKAALEVHELRTAAKQQPDEMSLLGHVSSFGINADYGKGFLVDALLRHSLSVLQTRSLLAELWPPSTFPGLGASMLPAGQLAVLCLRYLSGVYNALPEQQMSIELEGFQNIVASCCATAMDLTYAASIRLHENHSQQPGSEVVQKPSEVADLNSGTAAQILQSPCYLQCTGLVMALAAYHLVVQHNPAFSSSAEHSDASGPDSADQDADADPMSAMRQLLRGLQERQAMKDAKCSSRDMAPDRGNHISSEAASTAASGLQSRLPQLHRLLLQQLGFSSKLVAVLAASGFFTLSRSSMCVICSRYAASIT